MIWCTYINALLEVRAKLGCQMHNHSVLSPMLEFVDLILVQFACMQFMQGEIGTSWLGHWIQVMASCRQACPLKPIRITLYFKRSFSCNITNSCKDSNHTWRDNTKWLVILGSRSTEWTSWIKCLVAVVWDKGKEIGSGRNFLLSCVFYVRRERETRFSLPCLSQYTFLKF